jgi:hypothetical protein
MAYTKAQILAHWHELTPNVPLQPDPIPYGHEGSTYAEDGVRITGSQRWIDSVLSRLQDLLQYEGYSTRLGVSYQATVDKDTKNPTGGYSCYVQVHERGGI